MLKTMTINKRIKLRVHQGQAPDGTKFIRIHKGQPFTNIPLENALRRR